MKCKMQIFVENLLEMLYSKKERRYNSMKHLINNKINKELAYNVHLHCCQKVCSVF